MWLVKRRNVQCLNTTPLSLAPKKRENKMKATIILAIVSLSLLLFWHMNADSGIRALGFNEMECDFKFSEQTTNGFYKITVSYKNVSKKAGYFSLPFPADENNDEKQKNPLLALEIKSKNGKHEEEFLFALIDGECESKQKVKKIFLVAGGSNAIEYQLSDFWRWGPCGPDRSGSFVKFISPGNTEAEALIILVKDIDINQQCLESKPIELFCTFSNP